MEAKTYVRTRILYHNAGKAFGGLLTLGWVLLLCPCLCLYMYFARGFQINVAATVAAIVLISSFFIAPPILTFRRSKKYCDYLEERGLMEKAASQLKEQLHLGADYILAKDFYFVLDQGRVICLQDLVRIELTATREINDEGPDTDRLDLRLTTRQGDTLNLFESYKIRTPKEDRGLQEHFEILRGRYPDKAVEAVSPK